MTVRRLPFLCSLLSLCECPDPASGLRPRESLALFRVIWSNADAGLRIEALREHPFANGCEVI